MDFLGKAIRSGINVLDFWSMTPIETALVIEIYNDKLDEKRRRDLFISWHTAAFSRARRLPALSQILAPKKAVVLSGPELEERRKERDLLVSRIDLDQINAAKRKK